MDENPSSALKLSGDAPVAATAAVKSNPGARIALGFMPFTPVPFLGNSEVWIAWARLAAFAGLSYLTWNKMRPVAYGAGACALISVVTSLAGSAWSKK